MHTTRRHFISTLGQLLLLPAISQLTAAVPSSGSNKRKLTFGIISDVHEGLQKDAAERLNVFIDQAIKEKPDFIIQLGDMTHGSGIEKMLKIWNRFPGNKYHVLGNHEIDHAKKDVVVKKQKMRGNYYSFDSGEYHFVVLDASFFKQGDKFYDKRPAKKEGLPILKEMVSDEELEWLRKDLAKTKKPSILFSHEAFDDNWQAPSSPSTPDVRKIIREANQAQPGKQKVIACICGHHHIDNHQVIEDVHYIQINSASYFWISKAAVFSNGNMAEYKDSLYAFITLDPVEKTLSMTGPKSEFLPPAPEKKNYPQVDKLYPGIRDRVLKYKA